MKDDSHALYRFYSSTGQLLYVGITNNPAGRFSQHEAGKEWWHEVAGISMEKHSDRESVLAAEARAIEVESPRYNKVRPALTNKRKRTVPTAKSLVWKCDTCAEPVFGEEGYIHINFARIDEHDEQAREVEGRVKDRCGDGPEVWSGGDLMSLPAPVPWQVHHPQCDPEPDAGDYAFAVGRARTHAHLLDWTAHLMNKVWLPSTNWDQFIRVAAGVDA